MFFSSYIPPQPVGEFVERFWTCSDEPSHSRERILPSGTVEMVVNLRDVEVRIYDPVHPGQCKRCPGSVVSGTYARAFVIDPSQHAMTMGVHFKPGGRVSVLRRSCWRAGRHARRIGRALGTVIRRCSIRIETMVISDVRLRDIEQSDLPRLYEFDLDPDANGLAATIPRSAHAFEAHWENALANPNVVAKAILVGDVLAGSISCFKFEGLDNGGYWVAKEFWGNGIASRALELLLIEIRSRPLCARVATSNRASLRVLQKCEFVVKGVQISPEDDRYLECEETLLVLK